MTRIYFLMPTPDGSLVDVKRNPYDSKVSFQGPGISTNIDRVEDAFGPAVDAEAAKLRIEVANLKADLSYAQAGWHASIRSGDTFIAEIERLRGELIALRHAMTPPAVSWHDDVKSADPRSDTLYRAMHADKPWTP